MIQFSARRRQSGFSLIELLLVLGVSIMIGALWLQGLRRDNERGQAQAAGEQIKIVGQAVNAYIAIRHDALAAHIPGTDDCTAGSCLLDAADPGFRTCAAATDISPNAKRCVINNETLRLNGLVPNSFSGRNAWGSDYNYQLIVDGVSPNITIDSMVATTTPYTTGATVRYDLLGEAMLSAGVDSGMTRNTATTAEGYNGSWSESSARFTNITALGQLFYRAGYGSQAYNVYLRRDGSLPMTGDMNMDGHNIAGVGDLDAAGTISSNTLLAKSNTANALRFADTVGGTDRASIGTTGAGASAALELRANKVAIRTLAGDLGNLESQNITGYGNIVGQGTLTVGGNTTVGGTLSSGALTANGSAQIIGSLAVDGDIQTDTALYAGNGTTASSLASGVLYLNNAATKRGFALNTATSTIQLTSGTNLYTSGNIQSNTMLADTSVDVGGAMIFENTATNPLGSACTNTAGKTRVQRANTGELMQCAGGRWTSMGLVDSQITTVDGATACTVPNSGAVQSSTATCAAGYHLLSGGYRQTSGPTRSGPVSSYKSGTNAWSIYAGFNDPYGVGTITAATCWVAQAVCSR